MCNSPKLMNSHVVGSPNYIYRDFIMNVQDSSKFMNSRLF